MKLAGPAFAIALALALAPGEARATIPSCLGIRGTVFVAGNSETVGDVTKTELLRERFSTRVLLLLLQEEFPLVDFSGACIQVTPEDDPTPDSVALVDGDGNLLQDLTGIVAVNLDTDASMVSGTFNAANEAESSQILFPIEVTLTFPTLMVDLTFRGLAFQRLRARAEDGAGNNRVSASIKAKVSGEGTVQGLPAFGEGSCTLRGSGEFDLDL